MTVTVTQDKTNCANPNTGTWYYADGREVPFEDKVTDALYQIAISFNRIATAQERIAKSFPDNDWTDLIDEGEPEPIEGGENNGSDK